MTATVRIEFHPTPALEFYLPLRIVSAANAWEAWYIRHKREKTQHQTAAVVARQALKKTPGFPRPVVVKLTRIRTARGKPLDSHDNLPMAFKAVVDGIAEALGVDDGDRAAVTWEYTPEETAKQWGARVRIEKREP